MGVTFVAIAAEHPLAIRLARDKPHVAAFIEECTRGGVTEAEFALMEKKGVPTGFFVTHPLTQEKIEVWVGNYVLMAYGEGAVMGVPGHDERDFAVRQEVRPADQAGHRCRTGARIQTEELAAPGTPDYGRCVNSGKYDGLDYDQAVDAVARDLQGARTRRQADRLAAA